MRKRLGIKEIKGESVTTSYYAGLQEAGLISLEALSPLYVVNCILGILVEGVCGVCELVFTMFVRIFVATVNDLVQVLTILTFTAISQLRCLPFLLSICKLHIVT